MKFLPKAISGSGRNSPIDPILEYISKFGAFGVALLEYLFRKVDQLIALMHYFVLWVFELITGIKFRAVSTLIWSGGRMGRNMRYLSIVLLVWTIFLAGGVFQGRLVQPARGDELEFLATGGSIILTEATASTIQSETHLLDSPVEHTVQEGENLISIGQQYNISVESIRFANNLTSDNVRVDQTLTIPPVEGTIHTVARGDTIETLARRYNVPSQVIVDFNYLDAPYTLEVGQLITVPDARRPAPVERLYAGVPTYDVSAYGVLTEITSDVQGTGRFTWPYSGPITQRFSRYHPAIDIGGRTGDILAADQGTVVRAGWWQGGYGNAVQIDHGNGYVTTYAHMSSIAVSSGEVVSKGQKIGVVGSTGRSTGPHLHFTIQLDGRFIDPLSEL